MENSPALLSVPRALYASSASKSFFLANTASVQSLSPDHSKEPYFPATNPAATCRIKVKSVKERDICETIETHSMGNLRSLKIFILKTFPYFPTKFQFVLTNGNAIAECDEKKIVAKSLGGTVYIQPFIDKIPFSNSKDAKPMTGSKPKALLFLPDRRALPLPDRLRGREEAGAPVEKKPKLLRTKSALVRPASSQAPVLKTRPASSGYSKDRNSGYSPDIGAGKAVTIELVRAGAHTPTQPFSANVNLLLNLAGLQAHDVDMSSYRAFDGCSSVAVSFSEHSEFER